MASSDRYALRAPNWDYYDKYNGLVVWPPTCSEPSYPRPLPGQPDEPGHNDASTGPLVTTCATTLPPSDAPISSLISTLARCYVVENSGHVSLEDMDTVLGMDNKLSTESVSIATSSIGMAAGILNIRIPHFGWELSGFRVGETSVISSAHFIDWGSMCRAGREATIGILTNRNTPSDFRQGRSIGSSQYKAKAKLKALSWKRGIAIWDIFEGIGDPRYTLSLNQINGSAAAADLSCFTVGYNCKSAGSYYPEQWKHAFRSMRGKSQRQIAAGFDFDENLPPKLDKYLSPSCRTLALGQIMPKEKSPFGVYVGCWGTEGREGSLVGVITPEGVPTVVGILLGARLPDACNQVVLLDNSSEDAPKAWLDKVLAHERAANQVYHPDAVPLRFPDLGDEGGDVPQTEDDTSLLWLNSENGRNPTSGDEGSSERGRGGEDPSLMSGGLGVPDSAVNEQRTARRQNIQHIRSHMQPRVEYEPEPRSPLQQHHRWAEQIGPL